MNQSAPGKAILLVDHGSVKAEANELLEEIARLVSGIAPGYHVEAAHMELAPLSHRALLTRGENRPKRAIHSIVARYMSPAGCETLARQPDFWLFRPFVSAAAE